MPATPIESDQRLRAVLDAMFAFVAVLTRDGLVIDVNHAPLKAMNLTRAEVVGMPFVDAAAVSYSDEVRAQVQEAIARAASGESVRIEIDVQFVPGQIVPLDASFEPLRGADGTVEQIVASGVDISERIRAVKNLERVVRRYRTLASAGGQVVLTTDADGQQVCVVGDADHVRRYRETWAYENGWPVVHPDDGPAVGAAWAAARANKQRFDAEYRMRRIDGEWRNVTATSLPVFSPDGTLEEWVGFITDVTEQRRLQEQLRQTQRMDAVGQLAGGIAHDFNNLLTIICGCGALLNEVIADGQPRDLLADIRDAGDRASALTRQLLAFSRRQVTAPSILDVAEVSVTTEKLLRRLIGEDIDLVVRSSGRCTARLDRAQIEQVIVNLAINARDAMPRGGTLTIETCVVEMTARRVRLTVSDTGIGMSAEVRGRIFEPFFTTKGPGLGSGLGLSTVYGIVKQSGGDIEVESELGAGATFRIWLPCVDEPPPESADHQGTTLPTGTETILVVEDEAAVRNFAKLVLERCGYRVLAAVDGVDGIRLAREHDGPIDLLISDIVMPAADGRAVAEAVTTVRPGIRVLFMSGYTSDAILRHGIEEFDVAFLPKPFLPGQLAQKVRAVLDS